MRPNRWPLALALALTDLMCATAPAAPPRPAIEVENLRVGFVSGDRNNLFQVGAWTPVWVQLRAGAERFSGVMEVVVPDDDGTPTSSRQVVDLLPGESKRFTAYARAGTIDPEFEVRLYDARGRARARAAGSALAKIDALRAGETMVMTLGRPQGVELIPTLPSFAVDRATPGGELAVARLDAAGGLLPGRWYGYDAARAVVLDTNDGDAMEAIGALRARALIDWVRRGGHLVVAVGASWQRARDSAIGAILPAVPGGTERLTDLGALESFCGSTKQILPPGTPVQVVKLGAVEARGGKILAASGTVPLVVRGAYGFGRVTVVALDVDQRPFSTWADRAQFWARALDLRGPASDADANMARVGGGGSIYRTGVGDLSSQLRQALEQFPGVDLVPFGWVAFFIFLYILLIGPGDYILVKYVLKRMELTWITFPLIVVTVSVLAYVAAYAIKGRVLRVNKVDVVDIDQAAGLARGSTFLDVFSPQNRDYDVALVPTPIDRDAGPDPASAALPAGTEVVASWYGVPEPGFGGMGGSDRMSLGSGGYAYQPTGGAESLAGVRVPIWSTKCLAARWFGPGPSVIDADLRPVGTDRLAGTVTNRLDTPLTDAILAFNEQVYLLGTIAPGQAIRVELASDRHLSGHLRDRLKRVISEQPYANDDFQISRPDLLLALMFHDGATTAGAESQVASGPLHALDLTGQLALDRPMLVGRVDRPGTRLVLGNAPGPPQVDQTTMLRVILPLNAAGTKADTGKP